MNLFSSLHIRIPMGQPHDHSSTDSYHGVQRSQVVGHGGHEPGGRVAGGPELPPVPVHGGRATEPGSIHRRPQLAARRCARVTSV